MLSPSPCSPAGVGRQDGKPQAFNDIYVVDVNNDEAEIKWTKVDQKSKGPEPRSKHTAVAVSQDG